MVLAPIFEADLEPEQYAYREGCSAQDAVQRVHRLLNRGHREVVDADLSNYFCEIPHAELMRSVARRGERRATAGLDQGVVGDAGGRGRRQGWQTPHEPSATGEEGDAARRADDALNAKGNLRLPGGRCRISTGPDRGLAIPGSGWSGEW